MPTFTVSGDVTFPFVTSVEASSAEEAEDLVAAQHPLAIPYDTSVAGALVSVDDVIPDEPASPAPAPASPVDEILSLLNGSGVTSNNPNKTESKMSLKHFKFESKIVQEFEIIIQASSLKEAIEAFNQTSVRELKSDPSYSENRRVPYVVTDETPELVERSFTVRGFIRIPFEATVDAASPEDATETLEGWSHREFEHAGALDKSNMEVEADETEVA